MSDWNFIKVDVWWKTLPIIGVLSIAASLLFNLEFVERKHMFGLGVGLVMIGIGIWKAHKIFSQIIYGGLLSWKGYKYDIVSFLLILVGSILTIFFGYHIINSLI